MGAQFRIFVHCIIVVFNVRQIQAVEEVVFHDGLLVPRLCEDKNEHHYETLLSRAIIVEEGDVIVAEGASRSRKPSDCELMTRCDRFPGSNNT